MHFLFWSAFFYFTFRKPVENYVTDLAIFYFFIKKICFSCLLTFERERERQSTGERGADREGDTESEAGSRLRAVSTEPNTGLPLVDLEIMT